MNKTYVIDGVTYTFHPQPAMWLGDNGVIINDEDFRDLMEITEDQWIENLFSSVGDVFDQVDIELAQYANDPDQSLVEKINTEIKARAYDRILDILIEAY